MSMDALLHAEKVEKVVCVYRDVWSHKKFFFVTSASRPTVAKKNTSRFVGLKTKVTKLLPQHQPTRTNDKVGGLANLARFPAKIWQVLSFF